MTIGPFPLMVAGSSSISNLGHQQYPYQHAHSACDEVYYDQLFIPAGKEENEGGEERNRNIDCDEVLTSSSSASWKPAPEDDDDDDDEVSVYYDVPCSLESDDEQGESCCGGTILASLSSRDVRRNIEDSMLLSSKLSRIKTTNQPLFLANNSTTLNDMETIPSDCNGGASLSFTPTMAMAELHSTTPTNPQVAATTPPKSPSPSSYHHHRRRHDQYYTATSARTDATNRSTNDRNDDNGAAGAGAMSSSTTINTLGILDLQPERVACPFCDREKDLQWRLKREREQSHDLKLSQIQTRFVLIATFTTFGVAIVSFFIGKVVSDIEHEKVIAQYMSRCNDMVSQRDEEEMYWKLVTAAFTAVINAAAGPAANFVFGGAAGGNTPLIGKR